MTIQICGLASTIVGLMVAFFLFLSGNASGWIPPHIQGSVLIGLGFGTLRMVDNILG